MLPAILWSLRVVVGSRICITVPDSKIVFVGTTQNMPEIESAYFGLSIDA